MKAGRKLFTGTLLAFCAILLVLCALLAAGWNRASKTAAGVPDVRNNGTAIQWKYADGDEWHDLVSIAELRGDDGATARTEPTARMELTAKTVPMVSTVRTAPNGPLE